MMQHDANAAELARWLREAHSVVVLTGAGVSAESGLPTFRDAMTGLWANYRPEDLATPGAFARDPALVWQWYDWRRGLVAEASPNAGHYAIAAFGDHIPKLTLVTQNIDGLHQQARSGDVIELHGNILRSLCSRERQAIELSDAVPGVPPRCPKCGAFLRPDVVWFGENLPEIALKRAVAAAQECDLFLSIGTSGVVEPAASLLRLAAESGAHTAVINIAPIDNAPRDTVQVLGPSGEILPSLTTMAWG